jgi:predicted negative regulator of RcsB-dependent stress response
MEKLKLFWQENTKAILIVAGVLLSYFIYTKIKQNQK